MFLYSGNIDTNAVKNLVAQNLANEVFYIGFDTKLGREEFKGTNKKQVIQDAVTRMKRVAHIR